MSDDRGGLRVSGVQVAAGAAAAATAAFAASALGVAGTILGAALVSATITVLAAVYDHSLRRARSRLREVRVVEVTRARPPAADAVPDTLAADAPDDDAPTLVMPALDLEGSDGYHWRRIAVVSLLLFALAMAAITAFELVTGRPLSSLFTGDDASGTTIGTVVDRPRRTPTPEPSPTATVPSPTPTVTTTVTTTPTPTPTVTVTDTVTGTPTPTGTTTTGAVSSSPPAG